VNSYSKAGNVCQTYADLTASLACDYRPLEAKEQSTGIRLRQGLSPHVRTTTLVRVPSCFGCRSHLASLCSARRSAPVPLVHHGRDVVSTNGYPKSLHQNIQASANRGEEAY
jgi:hypothetical protein